MNFASILIVYIFVHHTAAFCTYQEPNPEDPLPFTIESLVQKTSCSQLTSDDCSFIHQALRKCPCTCERLIYDLESDIESEGGKLTADQVEALEKAGITPEEITKLEDGAAAGGADALPGGECIDGEAWVHTKDDGRKQIKNLDKNEIVLSVDTDTKKVIFNRIDFWFHRDSNSQSSFISIATETGRRIKLSRRHIIYTISKEDDTDTLQHKFAEEIKAGDQLINVVKQPFIPEKVTSVNEEVVSGLYSPVTRSGNIVVNDLMLSCYSDADHWLVQNYATMMKWMVHLAEWLKVDQWLVQPEYLYRMLNAGLTIVDGK